MPNIMLNKAKTIRHSFAVVSMVRISVQTSLQYNPMIIALLGLYMLLMSVTRIPLGIQTGIVCLLMAMLTIQLAKLKSIMSLSSHDIFYKMLLPTLFQSLISIII